MSVCATVTSMLQLCLHRLKQDPTVDISSFKNYLSNLKRLSKNYIREKFSPLAPKHIRSSQVLPSSFKAVLITFDCEFYFQHHTK